MVVASVAKPWLDLEGKAHLAPDAQHAADDALPMRLATRGVDRHEVLDFADAVRREEARDQDVGVGKVELLARPGSRRRRDPAKPASALVKQRPDHTRGVKSRAAVPVDRAVGADQRGAVQVAEAVIGDPQARVRLAQRDTWS